MATKSNREFNVNTGNVKKILMQEVERDVGGAQETYKSLF